jgi:hypothetical protein
MITPGAPVTEIYVSENLFHPFIDFEISEANALILRAYFPLLLIMIVN